MSGDATEWAWKQRAGGPAELAVLLLLARKLDIHGTCEPTTREIAEEVGCEQKTARAILARLRNRGLIEWTRHARQAPNIYELAVPTRLVREVTTTSRTDPAVRSPRPHEPASP